jgi:SagB-type dehydrogenase family enzyme
MYANRRRAEQAPAQKLVFWSGTAWSLQGCGGVATFAGAACAVSSMELFCLSTLSFCRPLPSGKVELCIGPSDARIEGGPWLLSLLHLLLAQQPFTPEQFRLSVPNSGATEVEPQALFLSFLVARAIIPACDFSIPPEPCYAWTDFGWTTAKLFHDLVTYTPFVQGDALGWQKTQGASSLYSRDGSGPPAVKRYYGDTISLPDPGPESVDDLFTVLLRRRTCRLFDADFALNAHLLGSLLHYTSRAHGVYRNPFFGDHCFKTSPSGGARHIVEIYPQIIHCCDVSPGSYYYDCFSHSLMRLGETGASLVYDIGQRQSGCLDVPIAFLLSVRFSRNLWKYRYSKSYLFSLFDVGHLVQTLLLVSEALGLKCFLTPAIDTGLANGHIGLANHYDESCIYLVTAGKAARGVQSHA